jgi:acyl carrier protein
MSQEEILEKLGGVFAQVLNAKGLQLGMDTTAKDVPGWDSLSHVMLVVEIEGAFKKRFKAKEIQTWQSVGDIVRSLQSA